MKYKIAVILLAFIVGICLLPDNCQANGGDEPEIDMTVAALFVISVSPDELEYNATEQNLVDGETEAKSIVATVKANTNWVLNIYGDSAIWAGPWNKPVNDILWKNGSAAYTPLGTSNAQVTSGGPTAGQSISMDIKVSLAITEDLPGDYKYESIVFEITSP